MKVDNPEEAVDEFLGIPPMEMDKSDWFVMKLWSPPAYLTKNSNQGIQRIEASYQVRIQTRTIQ
jgi:hypothetical protein